MTVSYDREKQHSNIRKVAPDGSFRHLVSLSTISRRESLSGFRSCLTNYFRLVFTQFGSSSARLIHRSSDTDAMGRCCPFSTTRPSGTGDEDRTTPRRYGAIARQKLSTTRTRWLSSQPNTLSRQRMISRRTISSDIKSSNSY